MYAQFFIYRRLQVLSLEIKQSLNYGAIGVVIGFPPARARKTQFNSSKVFPLADSILRRPCESGSG
jgi:hypothetical protein